ncbi:small hydrophilic protein [Streptomyces massasporeus]|uniref:small hydrophilic protein n=1 Tax=Streptomyces massasporeus TaxID=67324 RepID=UPI0037968D48
MVFSRRMAALSAIALIPLGIAATGCALADSPEPPRVPSQKVELDHGAHAHLHAPARPEGHTARRRTG